MPFGKRVRSNSTKSNIQRYELNVSLLTGPADIRGLRSAWESPPQYANLDDEDDDENWEVAEGGDEKA